ncbi:MAG: hypothetical protein ACKVU4_12090 [Phycisphaerales bacterium]
MSTPPVKSPLLWQWSLGVLIPSIVPMAGVALFLVWTPYAYAWMMTTLILSPLLVVFAVAEPVRRHRRLVRSSLEARVKRRMLLWMCILAVAINVAILVASWVGATLVMLRAIVDV